MSWIDLAGAVNARDLGGLPTVDGRVTRSGVLLRADNLPEPRHRFVTTGSPAEFAAIGSRFLGPVLSAVDQFAWVR